MITKERLKELIEQGATIWNDDWEEIKLDKGTCEICELQYLNGEHWGWCLQFQYDYEDEHHKTEVNLEDLEEDVEKGRWELKMTATRIETLRMPPFIEVCDGCIHDITFIDTKKCKWQLVISDGGISLIDMSLLGRDKHWDKPTKENYISACEICLKLFRESCINE